jgi:hypothetical protein
MYNSDFEEQCFRFSMDLWGPAGAFNPRAAAITASKASYLPHESIEMVECYEDTNGEYVPKPAKSNGLEAKAKSS